MPSLVATITDTAWITSPPEAVLLSYPHSGNTWLRYCLEALTGRGTNGATKHNTIEHQLEVASNGGGNLLRLCPLGAIFDIGIDQSKPAVAHKEHAIPPGVYGPDVKLILIVRNYKETVTRRNCYDKAKQLDCVLAGGWESRYEKGVKPYLQRLREFDSWPGDKLLIPYEALTDEAQLPAVLTNLLQFLGEAPDQLTAFMDGLVWHRMNAVMLYDNWAVSYTQGQNKPQFHASHFTLAQRLWIDKATQRLGGKLYGTYLKRYAEAS